MGVFSAKAMESEVDYMAILHYIGTEKPIR